MELVHEVVHSYIKFMSRLLDRHGTLWPSFDGGAPFDLKNDIHMCELLLSHPRLVALGLSNEILYTASGLITYAATKCTSELVLDPRGVDALFACVESMPDRLPGNRIFVMDDGLAEAVIYGGHWCRALVQGCRNIELHSVRSAQKALGATTVAMDDEFIRVIAGGYDDAVKLAMAWKAKDGMGHPDEFGVIPPNFWSWDRHARLVCGTFAGMRPWAGTMSSGAASPS